MDEAETTTIAHLSDLHFGTERPELVAALIAELRRRAPDVIVISGDLTQRARRREFHAAKRFVERLPVAPLMIPGNHDVTAWNLLRRFGAPLRAFRRHLEADPMPAWRNGQISILGVNTTRRAGPYLDWSRGRISARRLRSITRHFREEATRGPVRILVTHHPFCRKPGTLRSRHLIHLPPGCLQSLADCGINMILSGHFHHAHVETLRTIGGAKINTVQAGTAISTRLQGEPNSFNWISVRSPAGAGRARTSVRALVAQPKGAWSVQPLYDD